MSRQADWQKKMKESGRCAQCGKELYTSALCKDCWLRNRQRLRERTGWKGKVYATKYSRQKV